MMLWMDYKKLPVAWLPYRREVVIGGGFEFGSFLSLLAFCLVIGFWVITALPMFGTFGSFIGLNSASSDPADGANSSLSGFDGRTGLDVMTDPKPTPIPVNVNVIIPTQQPAEPVTVNVVMPTDQPDKPTTSKEVWESEAVINSWKLPSLGQTPLPDRSGQSIKIKLSYYWPPFGGINCDTDRITGQPECINMANGEPFYNYIGSAAACPEVMPFGTIVSFKGMAFTCLDRGGAIVQDPNDGSYWIDVLYPWLPAGFWWGQTLDAVVYLPLS